LFARTFFIVGFMLLITAFSAYKNNKSSWWFWWGIIIWIFALLFIITMFADVFPINLVLVAIFAALIWWMIAPAIRSMWNSHKIKGFLRENSIVLKKWEKLNTEQLKQLDEYLKNHPSNEKWNKIVAQAMFSTAIAVFATSSLVFISDIDFSFMWMFLFISLLILIVMWLLNIFIFKSKVFSLIKAYFWVIIFTGYLIYDFNTLEKMASDESWWTAISISVNLYLDIINLFLYILEILSDS